MQKVTNILPSQGFQESSTGSVCIGRIIDITKSGQAIVTFAGSSVGQVIARSTLDASSYKDINELNGQNVLLIFENGDPSLPIIIGLVHNELYGTMSNNLDIKSIEVVSDGERLVFEAKKELILRCGQGAITLYSNGKIVVKGTHLISRSSGVNKIKGATVNLN